MRIRRPTELKRVTASQELEEVLGPELDAPPGTYREVQILTPANPAMVFTLDHPTPGEAGLNRKYDLPPFPPDQRIPLKLLPEQRIYGAAETGKAHALFVIEYLEES
jgi:hypothetical protein